MHLVVHLVGSHAVAGYDSIGDMGGMDRRSDVQR
jgi:hypothetical protein